MVFYNESNVARLMGIKPSALYYYLVYVVVFSIPQTIVDLLVLIGVQEQHGFHFFEYLEFVKYKYEHRSTRWKGADSLVDENLDRKLQSTDQLCFQDQFYFAAAFNAYGVLWLVISLESMMQQFYNPFSDPLIGVLLFMAFINCVFGYNLVITIADNFGLWVVGESAIKKRSLVLCCSFFSLRYSRANVFTF